SRDFGGKDPILFQFEIRPGGQFIDLNLVKIASETRAALAGFKCKTDGKTEGSMTWFEFPKTFASAECKSLFDHALRDLKVIGFRYNFADFPLTECDQEHRNLGAMVLGNEALKNGDWKTFVPAFVNGPNGREMELLHTMFSFQKDNYLQSKTPFYKRSKEFSRARLNSIHDANSAEAGKRIRDHLIGCSPLEFPEDVPEEQWATVMETVTSKISSLKKTIQSFPKKYPVPIDLSRLAETGTVQKLDSVRKRVRFPLTVQSLQNLAAALTPGNCFVESEYGPDVSALLNEVISLSRNPGDFSCGSGRQPDSRRSDESAIANRRAAVAKLESVIRTFNQAVDPSLRLDDQLPRLAKAVRDFLSLKPFEHGNSEIASVLLQLSLAKLGLPPTYRLVWDDELTHRPEVLLRRLREEVSRRVHNAEKCVEKYRFVDPKDAAELLGSADCGMVPQP
ncbi:MAG: hypothetical protein ACXWP5_08660, partial [Bdellovibrionota bacterium]